MKKYIFLTMTIGSVGGVQQYIYNKKKYLEEHDFQVYVFSGLKRKIYISSLVKYHDLIMPNIMYSPNCFRKSEQNKIVNEIIRHIHRQQNDEILIEAHGIAESEWAELLSTVLEAKCLYFEMGEKFDFSETEKEYLIFKNNRGELIQIYDNQLERMIGEAKLNKINLEGMKRGRISCTNVVDDIEMNFSIPDSDITFGTIGRIDKPCMKSIMWDVIKHIRKNRHKHYLYIMIGGCDNEDIKNNFEEQAKSEKNLDLIILGYTYPIPKQLIAQIDVFLSTAGSAIVSYKEQKPTINYNPNTGEIAGLVGYDFIYGKDDMFSSKSKSSFDELLIIATQQKDKIAFANEYIRVDYDNEFREQLNIFDKVSCFGHYDTTLIRGKGKKQQLYKMLGHFTNGKLMQSAIEVYRTKKYGLKKAE